MDFLPYARQWINNDDMQAVNEVLATDWLTTGPKVNEFEEMLAKEVGAAYAVTFSSGTAALHAACFVAGICPGDEVITSPLTFAATANAILYSGSKPVFVDIEIETGNINHRLIETAITPRTKAIIPVDYAGQPADLDEIQKIARQHRLIIIEDAAHALGARYRQKRIGAIADLTIFSFHPVKHITTGEGGAVATNSSLYYQKLQEFRSHGITRNARQMCGNHEPWHYEMQSLGYNYRLSDIQCALGISQLARLNLFLEKRRMIANTYSCTLVGLPGLILPYPKPDREHAWHLYVIRLTGEKYSRQKLYHYLMDNHIGSQVHYIPVYLHPYYRKIGYLPGLCPQAEQFYQECLSIPLFPAMSSEDTTRVTDAITKWFASPPIC